MNEESRAVPVSVNNWLSWWENRFVAFADFHGLNIPSASNSKLPTHRH